jgi:D-alanyl-lipoteichoic acid acyltransferase DltB (MBOAT superfamily)
MLFHTLPFLIFMAIVLPGFYALRRTPLWIPWLLAASYVFYAWWNPYYLLLVFYSTALDYILVTLMDQCPPAGQGRADPDNRTLKAAFRIAACLTVALIVGALTAAPSLRPTCIAFACLVFLMALGARVGSRRIWLFISIVNNLTLLLFFKYARFVVDNINQVIKLTGGSLHLADPSTLMPHAISYVLPVGISFFTFQSMSYTIDFYLGRVERERNFLRFATFVCFFPQLMAGPIERAKQMLPQFRRTPEFKLSNLTDGGSLFLVGLFQKLALADFLALYVERVYDNPEKCGAPDLVMATFAFAWQIFFDFSGYTDMARGLAKMMGFDLVLNFNNPYMATGLGDFWSRWHISLSTWFRDYVYIPLGGNRKGAFRTHVNLFLTFLISGIWHGASWNFAIWGVLHGLGLIATRGMERSAFYQDRVPRPIKQLWVFIYVCFAWIFFRAATLSDALLVVKRICIGALTNPQIPALMLLLVGVVWLYEALYESRFRSILVTGAVRIALATGMILYLFLCASGGGAFIYFQF